MNLWFFNHYAVPPWLFPLARPYNFAKNLVYKGYCVTIFSASSVHNSNINLIDTKEFYKKEVINGINYIYIKTNNYEGNGIARIRNMIEYTIGLFKIAKNFERPDVIIATSVHPLTCYAGIKISKKHKCKCIVEIADLWPLTLVELGRLSSSNILTRIMYKLEHWIYKNSDSIIFTMEGGKDYIIEQGWSKDVNLNKVYYINNGIDLEEYNYNLKNEIYYDSYLKYDNTFKIIYTGSMGIANSLNYLVEAAKILYYNGYKNIMFILFGNGYQKNELMKYVISNNVKNVVFKGKIDKKYIPYVLSKSNLNVFTGKHINLYKYGLSLNKMFDYMASGKPILSNIECGYDMLQKYKCGITVKGGSAEALAEGILKFYNMPEEEYNMYCNNALKAVQDFDFKVLTGKLEKVILED